MMTKTDRLLAQAKDRINRLTRQLCELQYENAELKRVHKLAFETLRESA